MARLSRAGPAASASGSRPRWLVPAGLAVALVALAALRIAAWGWAPAAPDDARYLYVGLRLLDGLGAVTPEGQPYLVRAPAYPLGLALGSRLGSGDPFGGAHLVTWSLGLAALVGAIALATRLGGPPGGVGAAVAAAASALAWNVLPTLRIDLPQAAGVVGVLLLLLDARTATRWLAAGLLLGLTILVKESVILLALLPVAWIGREAAPVLARRAAAFWLGIAGAAAWWWLVVWVRAGVVFPANGLAMIESRQVGSEMQADLLGVVLVALGAIGWVVTARGAVRERRLRPLVAAGLLVLPPAAYAVANGLSVRNLVVPAILTIAAIGVAGGILAARIAAGSRERRRRLAAIVAAGAAAALVVAGQNAVAQPSPSPVPARLAAWLAERATPGSQVAATFRLREVTAVGLLPTGVAVRTFDPVRVPPGADAADYLWLGVRDAQLFGYSRSAVGSLLGDPRTGFLVVARPHPLAPVELLPDGDRDAAAALGLTAAVTIDGSRETAVVFSVDAAAAAAGAVTAPLRASAAGALAYAGGDPDAPARLLAAAPFVTGAADELETVAALLGPGACRARVAAPNAEGSITERFVAAGPAGCPSVSGTTPPRSPGYGAGVAVGAGVTAGGQVAPFWIGGKFLAIQARQMSRSREKAEPPSSKV